MGLLDDICGDAIGLVTNESGQVVSFGPSVTGPWTDFAGYLKVTSNDPGYDDDMNASQIKAEATLTTQKFDLNRGEFVRSVDSNGTKTWAVGAPPLSQAQGTYYVKRAENDKKGANRGDYSA